MEEGALEGVAAVHGIHVWPPLPAGIIGTRVSTQPCMTEHVLLTPQGLTGLLGNLF